MAGKKTQAKISAKIRKLKKEGKRQDVSVAQAIATITPSKVRKKKTTKKRK